MNVQSIILSIVTLSTACDAVQKETYEATGGNCPDPEPVAFDGEVSASLLRNTIDTEAMNPDLNIECNTLCSTAISEQEGRPPDDIFNCDYDLDFDSLPEDFESWEASASVGNLTCDGQFVTMCMGRRPLGHIESTRTVRDIGEHFSCAAHLEQASVTAFVDLARQLKGWNAPEQLISRCLEAADDETRHAKIFRTLAIKCGAPLEEPQQENPPEDLLRTAIHNATEGCIFETWAALIAAHQSLHNHHPELQKIYRVVAADETRHGQLAWDLHEWMMQQLSQEEQDIVREHQRQALEQLRNIAKQEATERWLGRPARQEASLLAEAFIKKIAA